MKAGEHFGVKADAAESRRPVRVALCRLGWSFMSSGVSASRSRTCRSLRKCSGLTYPTADLVHLEPSTLRNKLHFSGRRRMSAVVRGDLRRGLTDPVNLWPSFADLYRRKVGVKRGHPSDHPPLPHCRKLPVNPEHLRATRLVVS